MSARGAASERARRRSIEGANDRPSRTMTAGRRAGRRARRCADDRVDGGISGPRFRRVFWSEGIIDASRSWTQVRARRPRKFNRDRWYNALSLVNSDNKLQILYPSKTAKNGSLERTSSGAARGSSTATSVYKNFSSTPRM